MGNILVTGGCGFIGSNFVRYAHRKTACHILNYDALTYAGNLENLKGMEASDRYSFVRGRIEDFDLVKKVMSENSIDTVFHFAAESHVDRSICDSTPFIETNIVGTHSLLRASVEVGVEKFVHISTDEVYGSLGPKGFFSEDSPYEPNSPYSASKASSDLIVRSFHRTYDFPAIIVHCSNNYGPYQFPEKFIPLVISNAMMEAHIPLYGDGLNIRDWIYVEDFCSGVLLSAEKGKAGQVYNFGGESEKTNIDVIKTILRHLGKSESLIRYVSDRPGHDKRYAVDTKKSKKELGFSPRVSFDEGIERTIKWYKENDDWLSDLRSGEYKNYYEKMYSERLDKSADSRQ